MKLSIKERIKVSELLADQVGSRATVKLIRTAVEDLSLSEEEIKETGFLEIPSEKGGSSLGWNPQKDPMKDVVFGETVLKKIQEKLKYLDASENLNADQAALFDKFIETSA
jgi:hypothetical protein